MKTSRCLVCNYEIKSFMSFGQMPLGNGFRKVDDTHSEYFFELYRPKIHKGF